MSARASSTIKRRIAVIGPSRSMIAQPFAGGLEAHIWALTHALRQRGHEVTLFAAAGSDQHLGVDVVPFADLNLSEAARRDVSMPPAVVLQEHHAYLDLMLQLARGDREFDVVHNHSLHYLPLAMAPAIPTPIITTLHTPPTPWLESAVRAAPMRPSAFVAVSRHVASVWAPLLGPVPVVLNGVDTSVWTPGPGGGPCIWSGRIAPEKAPHRAVRAATIAGLPIDLAGPITDPAYFERELRPLLGDQARYLGHLDHGELAHAVGGAAVAVVTPDWDEPYGLVVAEALACGTPVAAFARGGVPEIVDGSCARLVTGGDVDALASAIRSAALLDRGAARRRAESHCSIEAMVNGYEVVFDESCAA